MSLALFGVRLARTLRCTIDLASEAGAVGREESVALRAAQTKIIQRTCAALLDGYGIEVRTHGLPPRGQALLVSNHLGWLDPLIVGALHPCLPLAKREIEAWPVLGSQARALGTIFVNREDAFGRARALREARRALIDGASLMNFPEGTTTRGDVVLPFRSGLFGVARDLGVPIVPIRLAYDASLAWVDDQAFLPHFFELARRTHARVEVHVGPPLPIGPLDDARTLAARARKIIQHLHLTRVN